MAAEGTEAAAAAPRPFLRGGMGTRREMVSELHRFRVSLTSDPQRDPGVTLEEEVERTARGRALELQAEALGLCPTAAPQAERALSRAVKLEPGLASAWIRLGELQWGRGDLDGARACFRGALAHPRPRDVTAEGRAHRLLSVVLRARGGGGGGGGLRESLEQAEAAVRCEPGNGASWYVLGNAYVSLFFAGGQSPEAARRALGAYAQAERVDPEAANNPDLHLNRATLLQYEERYGAALEGLSRAGALAPGWAEPRRRHAHLLDFLARLCAALANRPPPRGKRRRSRPEPPPGPPSPPPLPSLSPSPLSDLQAGPNPRRALIGRVLFTCSPEGRVPYAIGLADGAGGVAAVTVYNAAPDWGVSVGDVIAVPRPCLKHHLHQHQGQTFSFAGVRVPSPLSLLINGRPPPSSALAPARLLLRADPAPAPPPAP
ncbi:LOW QUALITY PROTEIN: tetratricopeptide repeat protein 5 [Guaruba guarouba]